MNQRNKYLPAGESSFPRMPLEENANTQGLEPLPLPTFSWNSRSSRNCGIMQPMDSALTLTSLGLFFFPYLLEKNYCSYVKERKQTGMEPTMVTLSPTGCLGHFWLGCTIFKKSLLHRVSERVGGEGRRGDQETSELGAGVAYALNWAEHL